MSVRAMGNGMGSEKGAGVGIRLGIEQCEKVFFLLLMVLSFKKGSSASLPTSLLIFIPHLSCICPIICFCISN